MKKEKLLNNSILITLIALILFLPLSAWLISLTGNRYISLTRDGLIFISVLLALLKIKKWHWNVNLILLLSFILFATLTYFWKDSSTIQWLKGWRFVLGPILLTVASTQFKFSQRAKNIILWVLLISGIAVTFVAVLELIGINIPLGSTMFDVGGLDQIHTVEGLGSHRLQSILAGPNALGLFMLAQSILGLTVYPKIIKYGWLSLILFIPILFFTFSRSSLIALVIVLIAWLINLFIHSSQKVRIAQIMAVIVTTFFICGWWFNDAIDWRGFLLHGTSTELRMEQYQRIWDSKYDIGLLGRGAGTAGPSSQYRLDNGSNHWTENIYLDLFEEYGLIGISLYLLLTGSILVELLKRSRDELNKSALLALIGFAVAGLFINYYTGQVGIFMYWIIISLALQKVKEG